jgi:hypothetical protein
MLKVVFSSENEAAISMDDGLMAQIYWPLVGYSCQTTMYLCLGRISSPQWLICQKQMVLAELKACTSTLHLCLADSMAC